MTNRAIGRPMLLAALAAGISLVWGCGGGGGYSAGGTDFSKAAGTWIEFRLPPPDASNVRMRAVEPRTKDLRKLTINSDGTFSMILVDKDGKPVSDSGVEGTWTADEKAMDFTAQSNKLPANLQTIALETGDGLIKGPDETGAEVQQFLCTDGDGDVATFKRVQ